MSWQSIQKHQSTKTPTHRSSEVEGACKSNETQERGGRKRMQE